MNRLTFSLLNVDYVQLTKAWNYRNVISPFYRLYLIDGGTGTLSNPEQSLGLEKGFLYLIPSFTLVHQRCPGHLSQYYAHFIETTFDGSSLFRNCRKLMRVKSTIEDLHHFRRLVALNPGRDLRRSDNPKDYEKSKILNDFREKNAGLPLATVMETEGLLLLLLSRFLASEQYIAAGKELIPSKILAAIDYIHTHLPTTMTVRELADKANLSVDHFSRIFYRHVGLRPLAYIHQKRVERAQFLLLTTDLSLATISEETGFESLSYFSRIFRALTGQPPGDYKQTHARLM
jgi:AraC-like DNA-binding protein